MSDKEYRSAIGFIYAGPYMRNVNTARGPATVVTYKMSAHGENGKYDLKLDFFNGAPEYVNVGAAILVDGVYDTWPKDVPEEQAAKTIMVDQIVHLGQTTNARDGK